MSAPCRGGHDSHHAQTVSNDDFYHVHSKDRDMLAHNTSVVANVLSEPFVDPDTAANYLQITRAIC